MKKNIEENIIYVSNGYDPISQYKKEILLSDFLFINEEPDRDYTEKQRICYKIRHQPEFNKGYLIQEKNNYRIMSDEKISGVAPGQFGVVYTKDKNICLGCGVIEDNYQ